MNHRKRSQIMDFDVYSNGGTGEETRAWSLLVKMEAISLDDPTRGMSCGSTRESDSGP